MLEGEIVCGEDCLQVGWLLKARRKQYIQTLQLASEGIDFLPHFFGRGVHSMQELRELESRCRYSFDILNNPHLIGHFDN
jgi:hypothetical protein